MSDVCVCGHSLDRHDRGRCTEAIGPNPDGSLKHCPCGAYERCEHREMRQWEDMFANAYIAECGRCGARAIVDSSEAQASRDPGQLFRLKPRVVRPKEEPCES